MGGIYRLTEWIMRLAVINLLWLVCSLLIPLFLLLAIHTLEPDALLSLFVPLGVLAPFTLFPATSAMFSIVRKFVQGAEDTPLLKTFFKGYKENYLKSMLGGIVFVALYFITYFNYQFYSVSENSGLRILAVVFLFVAILVIISMFHFFNFIVHVDLKFVQLLKNSFLMSIGNPIIALAILAANAIFLYVSFFQITFLVPFFTGSLMAFSTYWLFQRTFDRIVAKVEAGKQQEAEAGEAAEAEEDAEAVDAEGTKP